MPLAASYLIRSPGMSTELQQRLFTDLNQFADPHHARWDLLGLLGVRCALSERHSAFGAPEEHLFEVA